MTGGYPWARRDQRPLVSLTTTQNLSPGETPVQLTGTQPDLGLLIFRISYRMDHIVFPAYDATKPVIIIPVIGIGAINPTPQTAMSNDPTNWIDYFQTTALSIAGLGSFHLHTEPRRPYYVPPGQSFGLLRVGSNNYSGDEVIRIEYAEVNVA